MAVVKLGAFVTEIKGSIGGTCFKTQRSTQVMFKKSNGYSKNKLFKNTVLGYAGVIFRRYGRLDQSLIMGWETLASTILFKDKFGVERNISGRELYTKLNLNLQGYESIDDPATILYTGTGDFALSFPSINVSTGTASIGVTTAATVPEYFLISVEASLNPLQAPVFNRRLTLKADLGTGSRVINFGSELFTAYPFLTNAFNIRVYVDIMSVYGFKGVTQQLVADVS